MSAGSINLSTSGIQSVNLASLDIETAMMAVQSQRANLLEGQLASQLDAVKARNSNISNFNEVLSSARSVLATFSKDAGVDTKADMNTDIYKTLKDQAEKLGITDPISSKQELEKFVENMKSKIDGESNSQQMDMLRLQSLSNKRNEAFDVMTNFIKKMQESRSSIIGNMR